MLHPIFNLHEWTFTETYKKCDDETAESLKSCVDKRGHQIVSRSLTGRIQGFSTCLQKVHEGLSEQIVSDMADAVKPTTLPWVLLAPATSFPQ